MQALLNINKKDLQFEVPYERLDKLQMLESTKKVIEQQSKKMKGLNPKYGRIDSIVLAKNASLTRQETTDRVEDLDETYID